MEFRIQDVLKNLLPGLTVLLGVSISLFAYRPFLFPNTVPESIRDLSSIALLVFLGFIYIVGYVIDALSSLFEKQILYKWLTRPSSKLLNGTSRHCLLTGREDILEHLCDKKRKAVPVYVNEILAKDLFATANLLKDKNPSELIKERVSEYYNSYIFSRNFMVAILSINIFSFAFYLYNISCSHFCVLYSFLINIILLCVSLYRWRVRGFYYSRQVFYASLF